MNRTSAMLLGALLAAAALGRALPARGSGEEAAPPAPRGGGAASPAPGPEGTTIQAGDKLDISVFGNPELSRVATVQTDGSISLPFIGKVAAGGRTVDAIRADITTALERDYKLRDPRVSVAIASFGERAVYILGRVRAPGSQVLPPARPLTLLQLVSLAGGFEEDADRSRIRVNRTAGKEGAAVLTVDLTGVERDGDMGNDIPLEDGDTVFVPRAEEVSVLGQVNRPGTFIIKAGPPMTLLRAIARAEGFTRLGKPSAVVWVRRSAKGAATRVVDAEAILEGRAEDPVVLPGDVLFVPERAF